MPTRTKILIAILALLIAFAFGRFTAPAKVVQTKEKTTTSEQTKEQTTNASQDAERNRHIERTTTEITKPDGTREVVTKVTEDSSTSRSSQSTTDNRQESSQASSEKSSKEITYGRDKVTIAALGGVSISFANGFGAPVYGAIISKPILGPITVGIWGLSNGVGGAAIGLTF